MIPFALTFAFGRLAGDRRQGWAVFAAMFVLWIASAGLATGFEVDGNPRVEARGTEQATEGKEVRFGAAGSGLFAATTTGTSTGAVNAAHDSFTPLGGAVPLVNMMLGEVVPGRGRRRPLRDARLRAPLRLHRRPDGRPDARVPRQEDPGDGDEARRALSPRRADTHPRVRLDSVVLDEAKASILNPGPHGLSEVVYAFTSASNNNGSAFGGLTGNTDWYNTTLGLAMLAGRFLPIVLVLAIAGSLARKQPAPVTAGTFPTGTPLFAGSSSASS